LIDVKHVTRTHNHWLFSICLWGALLIGCNGLDESPSQDFRLDKRSDFLTSTPHNVPLPENIDLENVQRTIIRHSLTQNQDSSTVDSNQKQIAFDLLTSIPKSRSIPLDIPGNAEFREGQAPDSSYQHDGAMVQQASSSSNYANTTSYYLGGYNGGYAFPYLKFELTSAIPTGAEVVQAVLSLYTYYATGNPQHVGAISAISDWNEDSITYDNGPLLEMLEDNVYIAATNTWWDWNIPIMTQDWLDNPTTNYGLGLYPLNNPLYNGDVLYWDSDDSTPAYRPILTVDYILPEYQATFVSQVPPPAMMYTGQSVEVTVRFQNTGFNLWTVADDFMLGSQNPADNTTWGLDRVALSQDRDYGETEEFVFTITAPDSPGFYAFQWQMIDEGYGWFGDKSTNIDVEVYLYPNGMPCSLPQMCQSGKCVDNICCDSDCSGLCEHCGLEGFQGTCTMIGAGEDLEDECPGQDICSSYCDGNGACAFTPQGTDCAPCATCDGAGNCSVFQPANSDPGDHCTPCMMCSGSGPDCVAVMEGQDPQDDCLEEDISTCGSDGYCNGQGDCRQYPQGTVCVPQECNGQTYSAADICDGLGSCINSGDSSCSPYVCQDTQVCRTSCQSDEHCVPGYFCDNSQCFSLYENGHVCTRPGECLSGFCADGYCCNTGCLDTCQRCNLDESIGECTFIAAGQDPDDECVGHPPCGSSCNGAGECSFPGQDIVCNTCAHCDGQGSCNLFSPAGTDDDDACGLCMVCAGDRASCVPVEADFDPYDECEGLPRESCGTSGNCNGAGACQLWERETICGDITCQEGLLLQAPSCDGLGSCLAGDSISCAPYACDGNNCAGPADLALISIEDAPDGQGAQIDEGFLTTDDLLLVYAIGRDLSGNFLDNVIVSWQVENNIGIIDPGPASFAIFDPTKIGSGRIIADFYKPEVTDGRTGLLSIGPGLPAGNIPILVDQAVIPADGNSSSTVSIGPVVDADGNIVADDTRLTVIISAGTIIAEDVDPDMIGTQLATLDGSCDFLILADTTPAKVDIGVYAHPPSNAHGQAQLVFGPDLPVADAGVDQTVFSNQEVTLDGSQSVDPHNRTLTYSWRQIGGTEVELFNPETPKPTFIAPLVDNQLSLLFELTVSAGFDISLADTVSVTVVGREDNLPVAKISLEPDQGNAPLTILLDGSQSTAAEDSSLVSFLWSFSDQTATISGIEASTTLSQPGGVQVSLTVTDNQGRYDTARSLVSVNDNGNQPPLLSLSAIPTRAPAPILVEFTVQAEDPDGEIIDLVWNFGTGFKSGSAEQTYLFQQAGIYPVQVRATDDSGLMSQQEVQIIVSSGEDGLVPPKIISTPTTTAISGEEYTRQAYAIGSPTLSWSLGKQIDGKTVRLPEGMQIDPSSGTIHWTPTSDQIGPQDVTLVVSNQAGLDFMDFIIQVEPNPNSGGCSCTAGSNPPPSFAFWGLILAVLVYLRKRLSAMKTT
jgi:MYXO-CTERM domain-containing protein